MAAGRLVSSKWVKQRVLGRHPEVRAHIPATCLYSHANAKNMLTRHAIIVLKPVVGTGGVGVIKVERIGNGWRCTTGARSRTFRAFPAMLRHIDGQRRGRRYLVQQGIRLARIEGRPIDYRVKMVKQSGRWAVTAMVGRLARPGLFVTNLCRGGTQLRFAEGVARSLGHAQVANKRRALRRTTFTCVQLLEQAFPGIGELGFDYALDDRGQFWILEVNTRPH